MMSSNLAAAENGGIDPSAQSNWWLARWSSQIASLAGCVLFITGCITVVSTSAACWFAGGLQVLTASLILAIEGSTLVAFPVFTKPVSRFFEGKPIWMKTATYAILTIIPMSLPCSGVFLTLGFLVSAGVTCLYGMLLIGRKGEGAQSGDQPISP